MLFRSPVATSYYTSDVGHLYKKPERKRPMTAEELESVIIPSADEVNEVNDSDADNEYETDSE